MADEDEGNDSGALLDFGGGQGQEQGQGQQQQGQGQQQAQQQQTPAGRFIEYDGARIEVPPELWDDKANSPNVAAAVKRAIDLRRQLGTQPKAPEAYNLSIPDALKGKIEFDPGTDETFKQASSWGKKHNISQQAMEELAAIHWTSQASVVDTDASARTREMGTLMSQLGGDTGTPEERQTKAKQEMGELARWGVNALAMKDGKMDPQRVRTLENLAATADGVLMLRDLRSMMTDAPIPGVRADAPAATVTKDSLEAMMRDPRYRNDPAFQQQVHDGFRRLYGE